MMISVKPFSHDVRSSLPLGAAVKAKSLTFVPCTFNNGELGWTDVDRIHNARHWLVSLHKYLVLV